MCVMWNSIIANNRLLFSENLQQHNLKHREIYLLYVLNPGMAIVGEVNTRDQSIFVIEWTIRNFFSLSSEVKNCHSPLFSFGGADWRLKVYPYGQKEKNSEGNIDVYLIRCTAGPPIDMKYSFSLKKLDNKMHTLKYYEFTFQQKLHFHGSLNLVNRSKLLESKSEFSSSDQLTWVCQIVSTDVSSKFYKGYHKYLFLWFVVIKFKKQCLQQCKTSYSKYEITIKRIFFLRRKLIKSSFYASMFLYQRTSQATWQ